jgi:predicted transcriptional regulator
MRIDVLLSIRPEFAVSIFSGDKKFEFRKTIFKNPDVKKAYVYASRPIGLVVGEFDIEEIITSDPESLWKETMKNAGISKDYFDKYFDGRDVAHALRVGAANYYKRPKTLMEMFNINRPPQSFMYI